MHSIDSYPTTRMQAANASGDRTPPIRVLHVINGEHYAGAERVQDSLALRLPECGFEVSFACLKPGQFAPIREAQKAVVHEVPMGSRLDLRPVGRLAKLIRREGYAIVHSHLPRTAMIGSLAAALAGVPLVHHMHTQTSVEVGRRWISRISAVAERQSLFRVAGIIAVSDSVCRYLRANGYGRHRIWLVPNGVPTHGELLPRPGAPDHWTLGIVALFRPRKGLEVLLAALAQLRAARLPVRLRAVGRFETPAYERTMHQHAAQLGLTESIDWVGFRSDVHAQMRQMDVFVLPSVLSEGMPMSILEAMAAGTTVIGTRVDGVTDVISDGHDGLLAEPGSVDDLARVLGAVVRGDIDGERLRRNAHRRLIETFSDRSMAAKVAEVYREILER